MNIFEKNDYKIILKDLLRQTESGGRGGFRKIAEHLGVHATFVSQVLSGDKDFTEEQILKVCEFLGLGKTEEEYLLVLVQTERAGSYKLKEYFRERRESIRKQALQLSSRLQTSNRLSEIDQSVFYSSWIYSAVHLLTTLEKKLTFEQICQYLESTPQKTREVILFLLKCGMIEEKDGKYYCGSAMTHLEKKSPWITRHHSNWRLQAIQKSENLSDEELMYSVNVSISHQDFNNFREELVQLIQKFLTVVKDSPAEDVAQFNLDLFWIKNIISNSSNKKN